MFNSPPQKRPLEGIFRKRPSKCADRMYALVRDLERNLSTLCVPGRWTDTFWQGRVGEIVPPLTGAAFAFKV